jgi:hypothetical protein
MAAGFDELIDFLLAEIALCGTQGMWVGSSSPSLTATFGTIFISIIFVSHCCGILPLHRYSCANCLRVYDA